MSSFNKSFKLLRKQSKLSMSSLAQKLSDRLEDKEITVPQIQSYEGSSSAKYDVLLAIRDFYKEYDPKFTLAHLIERDLASEKYQLPIQRVEEKLKEDNILRNNQKSNTEKELVRARKIIMDQAETIHLLILKIRDLEL